MSAFACVATRRPAAGALATATLRNHHGRFPDDEPWGHQRYGRHHGPSTASVN
ncbi:hypothetical protein [Streptomyces massasporeus]|uniref:hypothetical protein n=1 Tax=Streptomyces massasporeus TaxID=67324 RepID=UPI0036651173